VKTRWWLLLPIPILVAGVTGWAVLQIPGPVELDFVEVDGLVYEMDDFPKVDLRLRTGPEPYEPALLTGPELAERIRWWIPESGDRNADETFDFQNGLLVVRATPIKRAAVRAIIGLHRVRYQGLALLHSQDSELKAAFGNLLSSGRWVRASLHEVRFLK
jgi:hypothetical protein